MTRYSAAEIEPKWQAAWEAAGTFRAARGDKPKYYVLEMFPYPSGRIHMGHVRNYTMGDVIARHKIAQGFNVLHPMGWDAFGMPAENAAMASGGHPKTWTYANIAEMKAQMKPMGWSLDWSRELATCDPEYYGQQQALFLDMLAKGLVYRRAAVVNWDPVDMTVLANEQVIEGRGWRSGALVERRELTPVVLQDQRIFGRSADRAGRAGRLARQGAADAGQLDRQVARAAVHFSVDRAVATATLRRSRSIRPAPTPCWAPPSSPFRPIIRWLARWRPSVPRSRRIPRWRPQGGTTEEAIETAEKLGFDTGLTVRHPLAPSGETLPVWIANFVLMDYGTGAIFGCPAHDQRDLDFARKYGLPLVGLWSCPRQPVPTRRRRAYVPPKTEPCGLYPRLCR